jgi:hypothetical protein
VSGPIPEDGENDRLVEPFQSCCDAPRSVVTTVSGAADSSSAARAVVRSMWSHNVSPCKTQIHVYNI